jgi:hypothetical protein
VKPKINSSGDHPNRFSRLLQQILGTFQILGSLHGCEFHLPRKTTFVRDSPQQLIELRLRSFFLLLVARRELRKQVPRESLSRNELIASGALERIDAPAHTEESE